MALEIEKTLDGRPIESIIVRIAQSYFGQKEIGQNSGWEDKTFEKKMKSVGWLKGQSWCAYFVKLVIQESYQNKYPLDTEDVNTLVRLFSGSVLQTYNNLIKDKSFRWEHDKEPKPGSIVFWKTGNVTGHIAIVVSLNKDNTFNTIEGNTSLKNNSNGDTVMVRKRTMNSFPKWKLLEFIHPKELQ